MTEPTPQRAWSLPTVRRASRALAPLAVLALMIALPALAGGFSSLSGATAAHAPVVASSAHVAAVAAPPATPQLATPFGYHGASGAALRVPSSYSGLLKASAGTSPALAPHPAQSTSANFELSGSDCASYGLVPSVDQFPVPFAGTSIASDPSNNQTIVVATGLATPMFDGPGGTNCSVISYSNTFFNDGFLSVFRSTDGGHTFSQTWVPINTTHWATTSDPSYGGVNWGQPSIAFGPNNTVMVASVYVSGECQFNFFTNTTAPGCSNATGFENDWGISVAVSTNGGATFGAAQQLSALRGITYVNMGSCTNPPSGFYIDHVPETPTIAIDPANGHAIVTWDVYYTVVSVSGCTINGAAQAYESVSTNMGTSWTTAKGISGGLSEGASVAYGGGTSSQVTAVFEDFQNQSTGISIEATHSANDGATWSTPGDIGGTGVLDLSNQVQYPDAFFAPSLPTLAADNHATSPYVGHEYLVWMDNQTGGTYQGDDAIRLMTSTDNGTTWSSGYTTVTAATGSYSYFEPAISVAPNGNVWLTYYGVNTGSGAYNLYGVLSTNGGTSWSPQFLITDSASAPGSAMYDIGQRGGVVATTNGAYPSWTDCRGGSCATSGDTLDFTANVKPVTLTSNAGNVALSVTTAGVTNTVTTPATLGWDNVSSHSITAPQYVPDTVNTSDVYGFTGWSGINSSLGFTTTFSYGGNGTNLAADYTPLPAATIEGTFYPSASASLKLNSQPVPLSAYNSTADQYKVVVASGISYTFVASAGSKYQGLTHTVLTNSGGGVYWYNFTLTKSNGSFKGTLTPSNAKLTINGTTVTNVSQVNGAFNIPEPWGWYWVNASGSGLTGFSEYLEVNPNVPTVINPTLFGGWISGTVSLGGKTVPGLVVKVDGAPVTVTVPSYTFNQTVLGGFHNITATAPGYNLSTISDLYVTPGQAASLSITLTNQGWLTGSIGPTATLSTVELHIVQKSGGSGNYYPVDKVKGTFNVSVLGNTEYVLNVSATGYNSYQQNYNVTPGNATPVSVALTQKTGTGCVTNCGNNQTCQQTNTCPPPTNNGGSSSGFPTTDLIIIVAVILLAAVLAAVFLMRGRQGGGSPPAEYDEGPATYQDTGTSSMPKLQSDGSFGGPPPPPQ